MTILTMTQAAQKAGISRSTLYRAIRTGRISMVSLPTGKRGVDVTELIRVFGPLQPDTVQKKQDGTPSDIAVLRERCASLQREVEWLRADLADAKNERNRLLALLETRLLQPSQKSRGKKKSR